MYKKLVLIICLLFGVGSTFAYNVGLVKQACSQSGDEKYSEEPPIHASINGDMFTTNVYGEDSYYATIVMDKSMALLIVQDCPQCSMEGVKLPNYDCPQWDEE